MNGAEALMQTLCNGGVEVCFANPGTSEMQLVAAIDKQKKDESDPRAFRGCCHGRSGRLRSDD